MCTHLMSFSMNYRLHSGRAQPCFDHFSISSNQKRETLSLSCWSNEWAHLFCKTEFSSNSVFPPLLVKQHNTLWEWRYSEQRTSPPLSNFPKETFNKWFSLSGHRKGLWRRVETEYQTCLKRGFQGPIPELRCYSMNCGKHEQRVTFFPLGHAIVHTCRHWEAIKGADLSSDLWVWICLSKYVALRPRYLNSQCLSFLIYKMQILTGLLSTLLGELNMIIHKKNT